MAFADGSKFRQILSWHTLRKLARAPSLVAASKVITVRRSHDKIS